MNLTEIFENKLKASPEVISIDSLFNDEGRVKKTQYAPPYQRNYVWDGEKATYFLESILIGTEIPPLIFFRSKGEVEIIDGRQRYETILKFLNGKLRLEAPGLGKPVLVMRNTTERPEALKSGTVHLVGTNHDLIVSEVSTLLDAPAAYELMSKAVNPYGDGNTCSRIVRVLKGEKVERYEVQ